MDKVEGFDGIPIVDDYCMNVNLAMNGIDTTAGNLPQLIFISLALEGKAAPSRGSMTFGSRGMRTSTHPCEIISMLMLPSARVANIFPAVPTIWRIWPPTSDKMAMSWDTVIYARDCQEEARRTFWSTHMTDLLQITDYTIQSLLVAEILHGHTDLWMCRSAS